MYSSVEKRKGFPVVASMSQPSTRCPGTGGKVGVGGSGLFSILVNSPVAFGMMILVKKSMNLLKNILGEGFFSNMVPRVLEKKMLAGAIAAAFIALTLNDKVHAKKRSSPEVITENDVREAFAGTPYAHYPKGNTFEYLLDAGYPEFPKQQGDPTLRDFDAALQVRAPNAEQSTIVNKDDFVGNSWMEVGGRGRGTKFFDKSQNIRIHREKWEEDDWCTPTNTLPTRMTPLYLQFTTVQQCSYPKVNQGAYFLRCPDSP